ncbi:hypothetical protein NDA11_006496 [Ustilago hordei]|uniref:Uncharacterized protein n=1 Tax=Ustilago hordei TaxID=120017 RepID=I2FM04_USTHO|nr:uncharacterized protein UHO2_07438 [Ustilago hordei]KAJ1038558.1 hypothetical protein NDA10_003433 [Ustilago hordei]KAJ1580909.1 hypothetical protein NDA15_000689 [Ustilago hordei]KAJ1582808.1 hypothetical protein NDA12_003364 [Ustilago hordei]KAJ1588786.1 hypothetical protein NDA11_006496 [Ustilago hordei]KAJ1600015.1 hypothetical protein NDA14_007112 [Ustilago hordei]
MKCFTLLLQVLALTVAWLSSCLIVGSEMPVAVQEGDQGIQHLWEKARDGAFVTTLPDRLRIPLKRTQIAWTNFLGRSGKKLIENIYTAVIDKDYGRKKYLQLVGFTQRGPYKFERDKFEVEQQLEMKRRVALLLVEQFAERMHQQKLQIQAEQARKAQEEIEKDRDNWGKWLTLGRDGGEGSSSGSRRK